MLQVAQFQLIITIQLHVVEVSHLWWCLKGLDLLLSEGSSTLHLNQRRIVRILGAIWMQEEEEEEEEEEGLVTRLKQALIIQSKTQ